jgi:hypothetical protein
MTFPIARVNNGDLTDASQYDRLADAAEYLDDVVNGPFNTYAPAWTAATTNPVIGNGSILGEYKVFGPMIYVHVRITMGSTTTYGSGGYFVSAPLTATGRHELSGIIRTTSSTLIQAEIIASGLFVPRYLATAPSLTQVSQGAPTTLASTHILEFSGWYT